MTVIGNNNRCGNRAGGSGSTSSFNTFMVKLVQGCAGILVWAMMSHAYAVDCSSIPQWSNTAVYTQGNNVQRNLNVYRANWWTQGILL